MSSAAIFISIVYASMASLPVGQITFHLDANHNSSVQKNSVIAANFSNSSSPSNSGLPGQLPLQKYGSSDPHGDDPHGDDPHDEKHDKHMKSNEDEKARKAPKDVYGGDYPNTQAPY